MPNLSRIRLLADQIVLAALESGAGQVVFKSGLVNGSLATIIDELLIGDLTVDTLQLENESVTLPGVSTLGSNFSRTSTTFDHPAGTFIEDTFSVTAPAGSTIYLMVLADLFVTGQNSVTPSVRLIRDGTTVIDSFNGVADTVTRNFPRFVIDQVTATGSPQSINLRWQVHSNSGSFGVTVASGSKHLRVAFKR